MVNSYKFSSIKYSGNTSPSSAIPVTNPNIGDIYINKSTKQRYIYTNIGSNSGWNLTSDIVKLPSDPIITPPTTLLTSDIGLYNGKLYYNNGTSWTLLGGTSLSSVKKFYAAPNGLSTNNGYSEQTPMDLQTMLNSLIGTGNEGVVLPGTYTGNYTISTSTLNSRIVGGSGGIRYIQGTITINANSSSASNTISGIMIDTMVLNGTAGVYLIDITINISFTKTTTCYIEATGSCDFQGNSLTSTTNINGGGQTVFAANTKVGFLTINNASAIVSIINNLSSSPIVLQSGVLNIGNGVVYSSSTTTNAITATGGTIQVSKCNCLTPTGTVARISISSGVNYNLAQIAYDKANSTISSLAINLANETNVLVQAGNKQDFTPRINVIMTVSVAKSTLPDGYVIFQITPTDSLPSGINLNDIVLKSGTNYTLFQSYANAPGIIQVGLTSATTITYYKDGQGGWQTPLPLISSIKGRCAARYYISTANISVIANQPINFDTKIEDTYQAVTTGSSWNFKAPLTGDYLVSVTIDGSGGNDVYDIYKNGVKLEWISFFTTQQPTTGALHVYLIGGLDYIDIRTQASTTIYGAAILSPPSPLSVIRILYIETGSDPTVSANYETSAGTTLTTTASVIPFPILIKDTTNSYNTTTGIYTCPVNGTYNVNVKLKTAAIALVVDFTFTINIYVNGTLYKELFYNSTTASLASGSIININGNCDIPNCIGGTTTIAVYGVTTGGNINLSSVANQNYLEIKRISL